MALTGTLGARFYYSASPIDSADNIEDFESLDINIEVGLIESVGEFGGDSSVTKFASHNTGRTFKIKSGDNNGNLQLSFGRDLSNTGQNSLKSYAQAYNQNIYPFKIELLGSGEFDFIVFYFGAKVMAYRTQMGNVNSIVKATILLEISTEIFSGELNFFDLFLGTDPLLLEDDFLILGIVS